jgi:CheY-like chemotaxis protein
MTVKPQRILIVDNRPVFRETLAQWLRARGHEVATAETGLAAFLALRDLSRPVGWLYTRAVLPGLIDGSILADAFHEMHRDRAVILSGSKAWVSAQGDFVLNQPTLTAAFKAICDAFAAEAAIVATAEPIGARQAA